MRYQSMYKRSWSPFSGNSYLSKEKAVPCDYKSFCRADVKHTDAPRMATIARCYATKPVASP